MLLFALQIGPRAQAIVEGVVEELPDEISVRFRFDDSLVSEGVRDFCQSLALVCTQPCQLWETTPGARRRGYDGYAYGLSSACSGPAAWSVGLDEHFDQNDAVVVPGPDALHEPGAAKGLFVDQVSTLGDVDARRAG